MSHVLIATMPFTGHVRPALPLARELLASGHEVTWYTGTAFADQVRAVGAAFRPVVRGPDYDDVHVPRPDRPRRSVVGKLRWDLVNVFLRPVPEFVADLEEIVAESRPDVLVSDSAFLPLPYAAERTGLPSVVFSQSPMMQSSVDTAPFGLGLRPSSTPLGRTRNRILNWAVGSVIFRETQEYARAQRARLGLPALDGFFMDWPHQVVDRLIHPSVPELEYPRSDLPANVEFTGALLPTRIGADALPAWWPDLTRSGRRVVVVTQGTAATNPRNLLLPAITALVREDVLVVATTGGPDPEDVYPEAVRPANLRLERFIPFTRLLPLADVLVTNGGFGGVQTALANGVPLVTAGRTEDKVEVNARVAWSGVGISLRTDTPSPERVARAVREVLTTPSYARRAGELAESYARLGGARRAAEIVLEAPRSRSASTRPAGSAVGEG